MKLYHDEDIYQLYQGNMLDMLSIIKPNSIDSIVTDPPYELNFMNKGWDNSGVAFQKETWEKCYAVLKPGGYLLAFGGSRTFPRIACAIEDAGFEIRDIIMWLYGSGFSRSMNLGKSIESKLVNGSANTQEWKKLQGTKEKSGNWGIDGNKKFYDSRPSDYSADQHERTVQVNYQTEEGKRWDGWGTCLKPAYEPIVVARKPCDGTVTDNVLKYGVGGINIDECRVPTDDYMYNHGSHVGTTNGLNCFSSGTYNPIDRYDNRSTELSARFPSNVVLTYDDIDKQEVCGGLGDSARYFYCAKASTKDREEGLENFGYVKNNIHPTVKPMELMQYLVRLVTPANGLILDPFNGSGSTGKAVMFERKYNNKNYSYIGIELEEKYLAISKARLDFVLSNNILKSETSGINTNSKKLF